MKRCYICKKVLPLAEFHQDRSRPDGKSSRCKKCNVIHCRKYQPSREKHRVYELMYYYGLTKKKYDEMVLQQEGEGVCAICKTKKEGKLVVDHNHQTGKNSGLLCRPCNLALGLFRESSIFLKSAITYLEGK